MMRAEDIHPDQQVRYVGLSKFGSVNEHTGQIFTILSRDFDAGSSEYLFNISNEWDEERWNVPSSSLEEIV